MFNLDKIINNIKNAKVHSYVCPMCKEESYISDEINGQVLFTCHLCGYKSHIYLD